MAIDDDHIEHFGARIHFHCAEADLAFERLVGAEEKLLAGLTAGVEGAGDLRAAEGAVREHPAVFAGKGHALRDALVDDVDAELGETIDVGFAGAEVAAFDRIVEKAINAVAVVLVVLGSIDAALGGDAVRAAGAILVTEATDLVAEFGKRGCCGGTGETAADDEYLELPLVGWIHQLQVELGFVPLAIDRS